MQKRIGSKDVRTEIAKRSNSEKWTTEESQVIVSIYLLHLVKETTKEFGTLTNLRIFLVVYTRPYQIGYQRIEDSIAAAGRKAKTVQIGTYRTHQKVANQRERKKTRICFLGKSIRF